VGEYLRVWLISPRPLTTVADVAGVRVTSATGTWPDGGLVAHDEADCECEDLNRFARASVTGMSAPAGLTVDIARRLRRLYDIEAAALATAAVLLDCPDPDTLAGARIRVAEDSGSVATAQGTMLAVPEYAARVGARRRGHLETVRIWGRSSTREGSGYAASSTGPPWWVKPGYHRWK
jgi:hypothetical protein